MEHVHDQVDLVVEMGEQFVDQIEGIVVQFVRHPGQKQLGVVLERIEFVVDRVSEDDERHWALSDRLRPRPDLLRSPPQLMVSGATTEVTDQCLALGSVVRTHSR